MKSEIAKLKNKLLGIPKQTKRLIILGTAVSLVAIASLIVYRVYLAPDSVPEDEVVESNPFEAPELQQAGKYEEAAKSYETTIELYDESEKDLVYEQIARNYFDAGDYGSAKEYYLKLKDIYTQRNDELKLNNTLIYLETIDGFNDAIE